jgi:hypothetical protein
MQLVKNLEETTLQGCTQKFLDWVDNKIYTYLWYYSLLSPSKGYGGKTH